MQLKMALGGAAALASVGLGATPALASQPSLDPVAASAAPAATSQVHVYQFMEARHSAKDLAVLNASSTPGQQIVQFTRNTGHGQEWEINNLVSPPSNTFAPDRQIKNRLSGLCLDIENNSLAAGAFVVQNPCDANDPAQRWVVTKLAQVFTPDGGYRRYMNKNSGLVMDITGASTANNARLVQYFSHGGDNQLFQQVFAEASF